MAIGVPRNFLFEEDGQDLIEYTLILAFVVMGSSALFIGAGQSTRQIWSATDIRLEQAAKRVGADPGLIEKRHEADD